MTAISGILDRWREAEARVRELQGNLLCGRLKTADELRALQAARTAASTLLSELLYVATDTPARRRPSFEWLDHPS